jgi:hypothetical protein
MDGNGVILTQQQGKAEDRGRQQGKNDAGKRKERKRGKRKIRLLQTAKINFPTLFEEPATYVRRWTKKATIREI